MRRLEIFEKYNYKKLGWLRDALKFLWIFIALFIVFRFIIGFAVVDGESMYPAYKDGEFVVYFRPMKNVKVSDVVCVWVPSGHYYIKRVVATNGDTVEIEDGNLLVNGEVFDDEYAVGVTEKQDGAVIYPYTVGPNDVFVVGDNREVSIDSRTFGEVNRMQIRGKIILHFGGHEK